MVLIVRMSLFRQAAAEAQNMQDLFARYFRARLEANKNLSLRNLSQKMGYKNPSYVSDVINGRRKVRDRFLQRFQLIEKLDTLELTFLSNLSILEDKATAPIKEKKRIENQGILKYWKMPDHQPDPNDLQTIDFTIFEALWHSPGLSREALAKKLKSFLDPKTLSDRVSALLKMSKIIEKEKGLFTQMSDSKVFVSRTAARSLFPILQRISEVDSQRLIQSNVTYCLSPENKLRAKALVFEMFEKIGAMALEDSERKQSTELVCLYSMLYNVENPESKT